MFDLNSLLEPLLDILAAGLFLAIYHADSPAPIAKPAANPGDRAGFAGIQPLTAAQLKALAADPKPARSQAMRMQPTASLLVTDASVYRCAPGLPDWVADPMDAAAPADDRWSAVYEDSTPADAIVRPAQLTISSKVAVKDLRSAAAELALPIADCRLPKAGLRIRVEEVINATASSDLTYNHPLTAVDLAAVVDYCCN